MPHIHPTSKFSSNQDGYQKEFRRGHKPPSPASWPLSRSTPRSNTSQIPHFCFKPQSLPVLHRIEKIDQFEAGGCRKEIHATEVGEHLITGGLDRNRANLQMSTISFFLNGPLTPPERTFTSKTDAGNFLSILHRKMISAIPFILSSHLKTAANILPVRKGLFSNLLLEFDKAASRDSGRGGQPGHRDRQEGFDPLPGPHCRSEDPS